MAKQPFWSAFYAEELKKLPTRKKRGHPDNILRAIAAGFVVMGYRAETAIEKAKLVIFFYDSLWEEKHD